MDIYPKMNKALLFLVAVVFTFKAVITYLFYINFNIRDGMHFKVHDFHWNTSYILQDFVYPEEMQKFNWKKIIEPCNNQTEWKYRTVNHKERQNRTRARNCIIIDYQINSAGLYTWFLLQTKTDDGSKKSAGGDYWRASITGTASRNGVVYDLNDGRYEIWFLISEPGLYTLNLVLEYSLCDGLKDPPAGWFEKGNKHGKYQEEGILGYLDDFLVERFTPINFNVTKYSSEKNQAIQRPATRFIGKERAKCFNTSSSLKAQFCYKSSDFNKSCMYIWDGYGHWQHQGERFVWKPSFPVSNQVNYSSRDKLEMLFFIGDSLSVRLWDSSATRVLCKKVFKKCRITYTWVYEVGWEGEVRKPINFGLKFNHKLFFKPLHEIYASSQMKTNRSVILINFGLHLVMTLNFSEYRILLDEFIQIIEHYKRQGNKSPHLIWKTTTLTYKEHGMWNITNTRFLTNQRISLFNAYTNSRLCTAGVPILDRFPISASYPKGPWDHVHYDNFVFEPVEDVLANFIWNNYNK